MKKKYIVILVVLLIYLVITFIFFGNRKNDKKNIEEYILFANNNFWEYNGKQFKTVFNIETVVGKKDFYIFENENYKGKYALGLLENTVYLFDKNNDSVDYEGEIIGFTDNKDHKVYSLNRELVNEEDKKVIQKYFKSNKLSYADLNFDNVYKYLINIDNDNNTEVIYNINNMFEEDKKGKGYSLIFINDNGKIYELMRDIKSNSKSFSDGYEYYINNIADLDNDKKLDFIVSKENYGSPQICYLLIQKVKKEYKITKSC